MCALVDISSQKYLFVMKHCHALDKRRRSITFLQRHYISALCSSPWKQSFCLHRKHACALPLLTDQSNYQRSKDAYFVICTFMTAAIFQLSWATVLFSVNVSESQLLFSVNVSESQVQSLKMSSFGHGVGVWFDC